MSLVRPTLSNADARRVFLNRHALAGPVPRDLPGLVDRIGFVQVDSVSTVERAHHMILSARSKPYRPRHLKPPLERDRVFFENWTHDASVIPTEFFPYWKLRFRRQVTGLAEKWTRWQRHGFQEKFDEILDHIRENGSCLSRDMGGEEAKGKTGWWDWHPSKTALEYLWRTGTLAVCRREGFQKVYDLAERVIPAEFHDAEPTEAETIDWACGAALDRLGFATSGELAAFWDLITPAEAKAWCQDHLGRDLIEIEIVCADGMPRRVFARPELVDTIADLPDAPGGVRILSPFDPALRDRKRAERLFGFHFRIEIFVPEAKRQYGYYVFPVLERDGLIGRIDMKRQGPEGALNVTAFWPEIGVKMGQGRMRRLEAELHRVARFSGCDCVQFADGWLRA